MHMPSKLSIVSNTEPKLAVLDAMTELMEDTPIDRLTVKQICTASGVSRSTFYRFFEDKYAVAQWHIQFVHSRGVDEIGRTLSWYDGYFRTEADFVKYKKFYTAVSKSNDYRSISNAIPPCRRETLIETIEEYHHRKLTTKLLFEIEALTAMELKTLPWWHEDAKHSVTLEEKCRWMVELVPHDLFEILNKPAHASLGA